MKNYCLIVSYIRLRKQSGFNFPEPKKTPGDIVWTPFFVFFL
jgi:hypothetical protein